MEALKTFLPSLPQRIPDLAVVQFFAETDSTNQQAMALGRTGAAMPHLVVAHSQKAGRGRKGRTWESPPGLGLYFSLLIKPKIPIAQAPLLTLATGLAIKNTLARFKIKGIVIKWPNDILIAGKKVCGVLSEVETKGTELLFVVLGIGLNVHQQEQDFSQTLKDNATSLTQLGINEINREILLESILPLLFDEIKVLESGHAKDLIARWENESDFIGKKISVRQDEGAVQGEVLGLNQEGHLLMKTETGKTLTLIAEETTLI